MSSQHSFILVHVHVAHIMGNLKGNWHPQKRVSAQMDIKDGEQRKLIVNVK